MVTSYKGQKYIITYISSNNTIFISFFQVINIIPFWHYLNRSVTAQKDWLKAHQQDSCEAM